MNFHTIVKYEDPNRRLNVQRSVYKCVDNILSKAFIGYFQFADGIEVLFDLHLAQIPGKEVHNSTELMEQIALNLHIVHFVTELCTTY